MQSVIFWLIITTFIGLVSYVFFRKGIIKLLTFLSISVLAFYLSFVATITIIARIPSSNARFSFILFWSYNAIANGEVELISEIIWNIVLFIPIGLLLMFLLTCKCKSIITVAIGILLSVIIELLQLFLHRGLFEFDDIIHNALGTFIAVIFYFFVYSIGMKIKVYLTGLKD